MTETTRSGFHRFVETRLGPDFLHQSFVSECTDFPPYQLDIYLPEFHACVEVDGPYHHSRKDAERDQYLLDNYKMPTLRIKEKVYQGAGHAIDVLLTEFIELVAETAPARKAEWQGLRK